MRRDLHPLSIAAQQDDFARALLWRTGGLPAGIEKPGSAPPAKRFGIYRNNVFASLTACLAARFPVVARLVGDEFFSAMARVFIERSPPTSPVLIEYGEEFAAFLATFAPAQSLPYLPDVARLEWRICAVYHSADARPVDAAALARLGEQALDAALDLHPSCALLASHHAVFSIWRTNTHDASVRPVDASQAEAVLIVRPLYEVSVFSIGMGTYAFVAGLAAGHSLQLAAELAAQIDARFDLTAALATLFRAGAIVGVRPSADRPCNPRFDATPQGALLCAT
ncbi:MAG: putative DNA-binding domain-containing protein [Hyphomicrobium sp.]|uniref:HvfC/BufC N-terminal domain-containing protein n=1 Tax=Hyphomicrobium sp. TaxID=82 RepID=UPI0025BE1FAE|nr:DNA-binding domain-containing protein [Hyphomicrobium sp.]MBZ0210460.1 putative DNA-binding domain-containing protein [Hyphomicrobium sp.]